MPSLKKSRLHQPLTPDVATKSRMAQSTTSCPSVRHLANNHKKTACTLLRGLKIFEKKEKVGFCQPGRNFKELKAL